MARQKLPTHVRLPNEGENNDILPVGILADIDGGSNWSISGLDVKEVPGEDEPEARSFVRSSLQQGKLEPSTSEEFDLIQKTNAEMAKLFPQADPMKPPPPWNEPAINRAARQHRRKVAQQRITGETAVDDEAEDYRRMNVADLQSRLAGRGLDTEGSKRELIARLEENDSES